MLSGWTRLLPQQACGHIIPLADLGLTKCPAGPPRYTAPVTTCAVLAFSAAASSCRTCTPTSAAAPSPSGIASVSDMPRLCICCELYCAVR